MRTGAGTCWPVYREDAEVVASALQADGRMHGRSVLVSGATGMLGGALVDALLAMNASLDESRRLKIAVIARQANRVGERFGWHPLAGHIQVLDWHSLSSQKQGFQYVFHAASWASPRFYGSHPVDVAYPNLRGLELLLEQAVITGELESLVYFSSGEVYGDVSSFEQGISETSFGPLDPTSARSIYAESKRMGEALAFAYHRQHGLKCRVVRPFHSYGPGLKLDDGRIFAEIIQCLIERKDLSLMGDGSAKRAFCYSSDATRAFFKVLLDAPVGEVFNVGNPDCVHSVADLGREVFARFPELKLKVKISQGEPTGYLNAPSSVVVPNVAKLRALGWQPRIGVAEGFARTLRSFNEVS